MNEQDHNFDFSGEVAIVTGASSGIGRAVAVQLAEAAARVAVFARSGDKLGELVNEYPDQIIAVAGDASNEEDLRLLVDTTRTRFGGCTILVNNAGHIEPKPVIEMSTEEWDAHFHVNVRAAFLASKFALYDMLSAGRGNIVNISSISGIPGPEKFPGFAAYAASKAALISFTELLAVEMKENGIRVNAISPGSVLTPMLERVAPSLEAEMTPDDIARLVLFIASPRSRAINGQNLSAYSA